MIFLNMSSDSDNSLNKSTDSDNSSNENTDLSHSDLSHVLSDTDSDLYCHERLLQSYVGYILFKGEEVLEFSYTSFTERDWKSLFARDFMDEKRDSSCRRSRKKV